MRNLALSIIMAFAVCVTAAVAQYGNTGGNQQGTPGSAPAAHPGQTQQPGQPPDMGPGASQTDQNGPAANTSANKGEKKLKGCVQSQSGQYVLETKKGNVLLAGQDVSAHVGHEVTLKGTWESSGSAANSSPTASSSGSESWSKGTFNVTDVKMESDTCKIKSKDNMGHMGSGSSTGTSGNSTGSGTGTGNSSTTPPQ